MYSMFCVSKRSLFLACLDAVNVSFGQAVLITSALSVHDAEASEVRRETGLRSELDCDSLAARRVLGTTTESCSKLVAVP